ncbi:DUF2779 domain-containing protein [Leptospira wolffii]|uniref:DUF2779 domain-containing protein n=1 Tax=Leptospira wolffii TaxID=409998 RepID=UPI001084016C|nr:DUF2779 domain-containing protein [Leptospira wolffii]TGL52584.1 DUF2779 domain-containing protein [Leptospira wolffii]
MISLPQILRAVVRRTSFLLPEFLRRKLLFDILAPYRERGIPLLGKSAYQTGEFCELQLWKSLMDPASSEREEPNQYISPKQKSLLREIASRFFPDSVHARYDNKTTRSLLDSNRPARGTCIQTDYFDCRADFIFPREEGWEVAIVKASASPKKNHIQELSFIRMVLEEAGYKVGKTLLFTVNSKYFYNEGEIDADQILHRKDCSEETLASLPYVKERAYQLLEVLENDKLPSIRFSKHCPHPRNCSYKESCYEGDSPGDLFTLREGKDITQVLWEKGIRNLSEVIPDEDFTHRQRIQVEAVKSGKEYLNREALVGFLDRLKFPLYYLDFETINPPVPIYSKSNPFQHVPFLFSLHIQRENLQEEPEEYSYIEDGNIDPRSGILSALSEKIRPGGTVLAFNDTFEKRCLKEATQAFPNFKSWFQSIEGDFVDLAKPFWDYDYYHPNQNGTTSLKTVLPVLTGAHYKDLSINAGHLANSEFLRIKTEKVSQEERSKVESELKAYCRMDTLALVLILRKLAEKLEWAPKPKG